MLKRIFLSLGLIAALAFPAPAAERKPLVIGATGQTQQIQATDTLKVSAATTANASINIPPGVAPSAPNNGDCWTTSSGLYCQIAGVTVGPMSAGGGLSAIADQTLLANISGGSAVPTATAFSSVTGVGSALKWTTPRTLAITGDLAYTSPSLDGSGNVTAAGTLATVNSNVGAFTNANITVNAKGLITAAANGSGGSGTVTTTGSPASGNLAKFSGATSITNTTVSAFLDSEFSSTQGSVLYRGSSAWAALSPGSSGQVLQSNGAAANPSWVTPSGGSVGAGALVKAGEVVTSGSQASVSFTSFSGSGRDLMLVVTGRMTGAVTAGNVRVQFNGDTGSNYWQAGFVSNSLNQTGLNGSSGATTFLAAGNLPGASATAGVAGSTVLYIRNYANTTFTKPIHVQAAYREGTATNNFNQFTGGGEWASTAAITTLLVSPGSGSWLNDTVVTLYIIG